MNFDKYVKKITTFVTIISTYLKNNPINVLIAIGLLISVILIILNITIRKRKYVRDLSYLIRDSMIVVLGYYVLKVIMNDSIKKLLNSIISYHVPILLIIISIFLIECFILNIRSKKSFLVGNSNWIINILLVVLWLYLVTNQSRKFVMNIILYIIGVYNLNIYLKNKKQKSKDINLRSDIPCVKYDDLFKSRKYQLEYILDFISKVNNDEYFSMVLNGDWGTGKTSLLNVLKEKLEEESHFIIYIKPMIVDNRESLMQYFIDNLKVLFWENGIYSGKQSYIKSYFESILRLMNLNKKTKIEEIFGLNMVEEKNYRRIKENLQNDIDSLLNQKKSKIILLIDDFDRIKKEAHYEVLSFINEVVDFTGVNVIFLMDYKKIIDDKITYDFMEKFINKRIDLSRVDYNEIIEFYLNLNLEQLEEKQCSFVKEVVEKIKSNHKNYMEKIKEALNKYVESKNKELHNTRLKSANQERIKEIESQIEIYNNSVENLYKNFENIRKLKNIIKEIVDSYIYIQATELKSNNELEEYYVSDDCIISIIKLILCKNMFYEEFNDMVESISFDKYISNIKQVYYNGIKDNDTSIKTIIYYLFEDIASIIVTEEKVVEVNNKTKIINSIIINEKTNDILLFKTRKEKYLEIIDNKFEKDNNKWCEKIVKDIVNTEEKKQSIDYKQIIVDLYDYILYDAYESNEKTKERISLVNEIFMVLYEDEKIEIIDSIDIIDNLFRRNDFLNLNYIILCKFWSKFKYSKLKIKQFNDKEIIKSKLKGLKFYTSNNVSSILKLIIQITIDEEEKRYKLSDEINGLNNLEDINNFIEKNILILSAQSLQEEFFKFDYFREQLKFNLYKKNFDNIDIDINYIVCRLTRYRILESIISRCISKLDDSKIMVKDYGLEDELEYLKDYNRFIEIVKEFYSRMERKNYNYNFSDMRIFNLSINKVETTFKDNVSNMETLEILESLYKKIPQKPDDRNYTKIQVQFMGVRLFRLISGYRKR